MKKTLVAGVVVAGAALLGPLFAEAELARVSDPNDARGRMDIRQVRVSGSGVRRYKIIMYQRWKATDIRDRGFVLVSFDMFANAKFDYYALVRSTGNSMDARLFRDRQRKKDYVVARLASWRAGRNSVSLRVPIGKMRWPEPRTFYRWRVQTLFTGGRCKRVCFDAAPNDGAVRVYRPGASPTPTGTPSPTPTGTPSPTPTSPPSPTPTSPPSPTPTGTPSPTPTTP